MEINVNNTFFTGKFLLHLPSVDSTNNFAKNHIANNSPIDGTVIFADEQFAGRGQSGNKWQTEAHKNLTFSIIYQTSFLPATAQFLLNKAISLGVWAMLDAYFRLEKNKPIVEVKWPNDIFVNNKKIAGILIENTIAGMNLKHSVIGIGLNVNQCVFADGVNATSMQLVLEKSLDRNKILNDILQHIEKYYLLLKQQRNEVLDKEYLANLYQKEKWTFYKKGEEIFEGKIIGIDQFGKLILETMTGKESFAFKEIQFL